MFFVHIDVCGLNEVWDVIRVAEWGGSRLYGGERSTSFPQIQCWDDWSTARSKGNEMAAATACNIHEIYPQNSNYELLLVLFYRKFELTVVFVNVSKFY